MDARASNQRTDPTGSCFFSYRGVRGDEVTRLARLLHIHGVPTWRDADDLAERPIESELRRVVGDPSIAGAILWLTPEVRDSPWVREVEARALFERARTDPSFYLIPVLGGGLDLAAGEAVLGSGATLEKLSNWKAIRLANDPPTDADLLEIVQRVLRRRLRAVANAAASDQPLRIGIYTRERPPKSAGYALAFDWTSAFEHRRATSADWERELFPALSQSLRALREESSRRALEIDGLASLTAAFAIGRQLVGPRGVRAAWRQSTRGRPDQLWSLDATPESAGFEPDVTSSDVNAGDHALLVSVARDVRPAFQACSSALPSFRSILHVHRGGAPPHAIDTPGCALDVAQTAMRALEELRRNYRPFERVHLFAAVPAGLAFLLGQLSNTFGPVQTYEHDDTSGTGVYVPSALVPQP